MTMMMRMMGWTHLLSLLLWFGRGDGGRHGVYDARATVTATVSRAGLV